MSSFLKIARHIDTNILVHVDQANNGLSCRCKCEECGAVLEAHQGAIKDWHFKHYIKSNCPGSPITATHNMGVQILIDNSQINIPIHGSIVYSEPRAEVGLNNIRPDVSTTSNFGPIYFEIYVTHKIDTCKENKIIASKHKFIEIDLSKGLNASYSELKSLVLDTIHNKRIIYWEDQAVQQFSTLQPLINKNGIQYSPSVLEEILSFLKNNVIVALICAFFYYRIWRKAPILTSVFTLIAFAILNPSNNAKNSI